MRFFILFLIIIFHDVYAITLGEYLRQVKAQSYENKEIQAKINSLQSAHEDVAIGFSPYLHLQAKRYKDKSETSIPTFQGDMTKETTITTSVSKKFTTGTTVSLTSYIDKKEVSGASLTEEKEYAHSNRLKIEQPLLKGFMANDLKAQIDEVKYSSSQSIKQLEGAQSQLRYRAKVNYWSFALQSKIVELRENSLNRAEEVLRWTRDRRRLGVSELADVYNSQASVARAHTALEQAKQKFDEAKRSFNELRGDLKNQTVSPDVKWESAPQPIGRQGTSANVSAAQMAVSQAHATLEKRRQSVLPELNVYYEYALNGRDTDSSTSFREARESDHNKWEVGITLSAPLDIFRINKIHESTKSGVVAADYGLKKYQVQEDRQWGQLEFEKGNIERQMEFSKKMMDSYNKALKAERQRFKQGRSTLASVNQVEGDYLLAQETFYTAVFSYQELLARVDVINNRGFAE